MKIILNQFDSKSGGDSLGLNTALMALKKDETTEPADGDLFSFDGVIEINGRDVSLSVYDSQKYWRKNLRGIYSTVNKIFCVIDASNAEALRHAKLERNGFDMYSVLDKVCFVVYATDREALDIDAVRTQLKIDDQNHQTGKLFVLKEGGFIVPEGAKERYKAEGYFGAALAGQCLFNMQPAENCYADQVMDIVKSELASTLRPAPRP